jgi:hypothetical protein
MKSSSTTGDERAPGKPVTGRAIGAVASAGGEHRLSWSLDRARADETAPTAWIADRLAAAR